MQPSEIGRSYDKIAHIWREPHLRSNGLAAHQRAIQFCGSGRKALDIGCGCSGRFIDLLTKNQFDVEGIDISTEMIRLARETHPHIRFYCEDIRRLPLPQEYDFITAWDSIWHLPLNDQEPVIRKICSALAPSGVFIFTTGGLDEPSEKSDSSMGPTVYYSVLGIPKTLDLLAKCGCVCRHLEFDQYPEKHLYIIAQKTEPGAAANP